MSLATMKSPIIGLGGPSTHTNNQLLRFDGDNTKLIQTCPDIYVDDNGKLSIGLTSPSSKLQQAQFSADSTGSYHTFSKSRNATVDAHTIVQDNDVIGGIKFTPSDGADFGTISALIQAEVDDSAPAASSIGGALTFSTAEGVASDDLTERLRINKNGNVGIGTETPGAGFHVKKDINPVAIIERDNTTDVAMRFINSDSDVFSIGWDNSLDSFTFNNNLDLTNNHRMVIQASGNVGIGETNPATLVELTHTAPYITLHNSTEEDINGGRESKIIARGEQSGGEETILGEFEFCHDGSSDDPKGRLVVRLNNGTSSTERMRIDSAGVVSFQGNIYPMTDNSYYLGKNDDDTPFAWKGVILKDTTNGKYYRIEVINGAITATDLTD